MKHSPAVRLKITVDLIDLNQQEYPNPFNLGEETYTFQQPSWPRMMTLAHEIHRCIKDWCNNRMTTIDAIEDANKEA